MVLERGRQLTARFACCVLAIYAVLYTLSFPIDRLPGPFIPIANYYARGVYAVESWVAKGIFGIERPLEFVYHPNGGGDSTTDFIRLFCIVVVALTGSAAWMIAMPSRDPRALRSYIHVYLRYFLATAMLMYGLAKVTPEGQFYFPRLDYLIRPLGDLGRSDVLAAFMGSSFAYTLFAGLGETLGGLLLLSRRTAPLGALVLIPILLNVLVMNTAYGWDVKIGSAHFLLIACVLAAPLIQRLLKLVFKDQPVPPLRVDSPVLALWPRTRFGMKVAMVSWFGWLAIGQIWRLPAQWGDPSKTAFYGIWDVAAMDVGGDVLSPSLTESRRWRTVVFERNQRVVVRPMSDSLRSFRATIDTSARKLRLTRGGDTTSIGAFDFEKPKDGSLILVGTFDALPTRLTLVPSKRTFRLGACPLRVIVDRFC